MTSNETATCDQCYAVVQRSDIDRHRAWHDGLARRELTGTAQRLQPHRRLSASRSRARRPGGL